MPVYHHERAERASLTEAEVQQQQKSRYRRKQWRVYFCDQKQGGWQKEDGEPSTTQKEGWITCIYTKG